MQTADQKESANSCASRGDDPEDGWEDEAIPDTETVKLSLQVAPSADVCQEGGCRHIVVSVSVPDAGERAPVDICCVIDVSGSMGSMATYEQNGVVRNDGLSFLSIVKHVVKAVVKLLLPGDRLALVSFSYEAQCVLPLQAMTEDGQERAMEAVDNLRATGQTNLWSGILEGMEALRVSPNDVEGRQRSIIVLTDGQPNLMPHKGYIQELQDYRESHPGFGFQLNTFGFGYNLDSELLLNLAVEGQGAFAFIPDAIIVGTVFVSSVANVLSTLTQRATLHLMPRGGAEFVGPVLGVSKSAVTEASWGRVVSLGPLQFGQTRDVTVPMHLPAGQQPYLEAVLVCPSSTGRPETRVALLASRRRASAEAIVAALRGEMIDGTAVAVTLAAAGRSEAARQLLLDIAQRAARLHPSGVLSLRADLEGRMAKAVDGLERFRRWGQHYLRALARAHQLQVCTNVMDPGLQMYGGSLFRQLRDEGDAIFVSLPAPRPNRPKPLWGASTPPPSLASASTVTSRANSPDMRTYYAAQGGG